MINSVSTGFSGMVIIGVRVDEGLKIGKIQGGSNSQARGRKPFNGYKKNEYEENDISSQRGKVQHKALVPMPYFPYPYIETA